jgi:hypothetical protein
MPKHLGKVLAEDGAGDGVGELHCAVMALLSAWAIATAELRPWDCATAVASAARQCTGKTAQVGWKARGGLVI